MSRCCDVWRVGGLGPSGSLTSDADGPCSAAPQSSTPAGWLSSSFFQPTRNRSQIPHELSMRFATWTSVFIFCKTLPRQAGSSNFYSNGAGYAEMGRVFTDGRRVPHFVL